MTGGSITVATVAANRFVPQARVLAGSLARHHPDLRLEVCRIERTSGDNGAGHPISRDTALDEIGIPELDRLRFRHPERDVAISAKAHFLRHLLSSGHERVLFLDADTWVVDTLDPLLAAAARHDAVLTPHRLTPARGSGAAERELTLLRAGTFNGGVVSFSTRALEFVDWWCARIRERFSHETSRGLHGDQRWLDLAPGFVPDLHVLRDPGVNVAPWNLDERPVRIDGAGVLAAGVPCRLLHWSGFDPDEPFVLSRHGPARDLASLGDVETLARKYRREVVDAGWAEYRDRPESFGKFDDGALIPDFARMLYRELGTGVSRFGDPFRSGPGSFRDWLNEPDPAAPSGITRLWWAVYRARADVRAAFPDPHRVHREGLLAWCRNSGAREHGIDASFPPLAP